MQLLLDDATRVTGINCAGISPNAENYKATKNVTMKDFYPDTRGTSLRGI